MNGFINELVGAIAQVLVFSLIPFIWWLITARKKESFFSWIGLKKIEHKGSAVITILVSAAVFLAYGLATRFFTGLFSGVITSAGSQFAGMGNSYIPVAIIYGFVRIDIRLSGCLILQTSSVLRQATPSRHFSSVLCTAFPSD